MNDAPTLQTMLDDLALVTRELLIDPTDPHLANELRRDYPHLDIDGILARIPTDRDGLTAELLDNSLCPLHRRDYAICFDDDDPECAAIRIIHPTHDS